MYQAKFSHAQMLVQVLKGQFHPVKIMYTLHSHNQTNVPSRATIKRTVTLAILLVHDLLMTATWIFHNQRRNWDGYLLLVGRITPDCFTFRGLHPFVGSAFLWQSSEFDTEQVLCGDSFAASGHIWQLLQMVTLSLHSKHNLWSNAIAFEIRDASPHFLPVE